MSVDVAALQRLGLYPFFRVVDAAPDAATVIIDGRRRLNFASNDYLGLSHHPALLAAAFSALRRYGVGVTGARPLNGNISAAHDLESVAARFVGAEDAVVFPSGYHALLGVTTVLAANEARVLYRAGSHGAIVDAGRAAGGGTTYSTDDELSRVLRAGDIVVCEGTRGIDGARSDLEKIADTCASFDAILVVDDSHGLGVVGRGGRGTIDSCSITLSDRVVLVAALSKALASNGGVVATSRLLAERLRHEATPLHNSVGITPVAASTAAAAFALLERDRFLCATLAKNVALLTRALSERKVPVVHRGGPVVLLECRSDVRALGAAVALLAHGVFSVPVLAEPAGARPSAIRLSVTAAHTAQQLEDAADAVAEVMKPKRAPVEARA
jgi:8-amino-7-oxononanoate synthase